MLPFPFWSSSGCLLARAFGWLWMDPLAGLIGALVIANWSVGLLRDTGGDPARPHAGSAHGRAGSPVDRDRGRSGHRPASVAARPGHLGAIVSVATTGRREAAHYRQRLATLADLSHVTVEVQRPYPLSGLIRHGEFANPGRSSSGDGRCCRLSQPHAIIQWLLGLSCNCELFAIRHGIAVQRLSRAECAPLSSPAFGSQWPVFPGSVPGRRQICSDDRRDRRNVRAGKIQPMSRRSRTRRTLAGVGLGMLALRQSGRCGRHAAQGAGAQTRLRLDRILYRRPCRLWRRQFRPRHQSAPRAGHFLPHSITGLIGGYQAGYNGSFRTMSCSASKPMRRSPVRSMPRRLVPRRFNTTLDYVGTVRGRIGYAFGHWMPYVTGGFAWGHSHVNLNDGRGERRSQAWTDPDRLDRGRGRRVCRERQLERQARIRLCRSVASDCTIWRLRIARRQCRSQRPPRQTRAELSLRR